MESGLLCLQAFSLDVQVNRSGSGRLCLQAFGLDFEIYRSGEWTVVLTGI